MRKPARRPIKWLKFALQFFQICQRIINFMIYYVGTIYAGHKIFFACDYIYMYYIALHIQSAIFVRLQFMEYIDLLFISHCIYA